ncbi:MAG TPA: HIT family protein [Gemmataceae bacterium]|nr:HIT family protein [Gemmataceae bacterium]
MEQDCPFCRKIVERNRLAPEELVWRFPYSVALLGPWQFYEGYCILVSRHHATELNHLDETVRRAYLDEMCLLARAIEVVFRPHKLNYELLGNQVPHLHWHLFPRSLADPDRLRPVWLALDEAERNPVRRQQLQGNADRNTITATLRRQLEALNAPVA